MATTRAEGAKLAGKAVSRYRRQAALLEIEFNSNTQDLAKLEAQLAEAGMDLALKLIPSPEPEVLHGLSRLLEAPFLEEERERMQASRESKLARLREIEADPEFQTREVSAEAAMKECRGQLDRLVAQLEVFDNKSFHWMAARQSDQEQGRSSFQQFFRSVSLAAVREERVKKKLCHELKYPDWDALVNAFNQLSGQKIQLAEKLATFGSRAERVAELEEEFRRLKPWLDDYQAALRQGLADKLAEHFAGLDLARLYQRAKGTVRQMVSRILALRAKGALLKEMSEVLKLEVHDRKERAERVEAIEKFWKNTADEVLQADVESWLSATPEAKQSAAEGQVKRFSTLRRALLEFQDWAQFDQRLQEQGQQFDALQTLLLGTTEELPEAEFLALFNQSLMPSDICERLVAAQAEQWAASDLALVEHYRVAIAR